MGAAFHFDPKARAVGSPHPLTGGEPATIDTCPSMLWPAGPGRQRLPEASCPLGSGAALVRPYSISRPGKRGETAHLFDELGRNAACEGGPLLDGRTSGPAGGQDAPWDRASPVARNGNDARTAAGTAGEHHCVRTQATPGFLAVGTSPRRTFDEPSLLPMSVSRRWRAGDGCCRPTSS